MSVKKIILILGIILVSFVLCSGCRASPVLEQVIYTEDEAPIDPEDDADVNDNDEEHTEKDDDLSARDEDEESSTEREREQTEPEHGTDEAPDEAPDIVYDEHSVGTGEASTTPTDGLADPESSTPSEQMVPSEVPAIDPSANTVLRQIVDGYGVEVPVPENVDTVAAVGSNAAMVEMLGSSGRLVATSADFLSDPMTAQVFSSDVANTTALWSGDGSTGLSDAGFASLLDLAPQVCFVVSGSWSFSNEQLAALNEHGIYCVTLPKLNTPDNIKTAVTIIGEVLGDRSEEGGTNAPAIAEEYCRWYDSIVSAVSGRVKRFNYNNVDYSFDRYSLRGDTYLESETDNGFYTLYLSDWDTSASYQVYSDSFVTLSGSGVAIAPSGYSTTPFSYYMSLAGVVNTAAAAADQFRLRQWYVNPLQSSTRIIEITGSRGTSTDESLTSIKDPSSGETLGLGDARFPALVVENSAIRDALLADAASNKLWTNYGEVASSDGKVSGYGFSDEIGQFVSTSIRGDYGIYVVPCGVDSWSSGSAESVLASMWTAMNYYNAFTEDELISEIQNFYSHFYHFDLSRDQAAKILRGR